MQLFNLPWAGPELPGTWLLLSGKTLCLWGWFKVSNITLMWELGSQCQDLTLRSQVKPGLFLDKARARAEWASECLPILRVAYPRATGLSQPKHSGKMTWEFTCTPKREALNSTKSPSH